ncbi:hypothetical protein ACIQT3_18905 [Enterobacter sichuanensis]|uniref:hypothetical protein n=1 Tax=Enterobacter sichuanensis TaxID=2071710 RepID=UPI00383BF52B
MAKIFELFHGTRQRFDSFDAAFKGTGEAGTIDACWFTDNFKGAKNHAVLKNRNSSQPLVYRCELTENALLADHSIPLSEQPQIDSLIRSSFPVSISESIKAGCDWHCFSRPHYQMDRKGKIVHMGPAGLDCDEVISLYKQCGIHGVYDWEGMFTDGYLHGTTIIMFDFSELRIREVIEV